MILLVTKTDPDAGHHGFTLFLVPMDRPGWGREQKLRKMGMHRLGHRAAVLRRRVGGRLGGAGHVGKGFEHIMWSCRPSG